MTTHGARERPRALFIGFDKSEVERFAPIFPTRWSVPHATVGKSVISHEEIDVVISANDLEDFADRNHVIVFGTSCTPPGPIVGSWLNIQTAIGEEIVQTPAPAELDALQSDLLAASPSARGQSVMDLDFSPRLSPHVLDPARRRIWEGALLLAKRPPGPLATVFLRDAEKKDVPPLGVAFFPNSVPDRLACVRAVLLLWAAIDPGRFPGIRDWEKTREWATRAELSCLDELDAFCAKKRAAIEALEATERTHVERLAEARTAAAAAERRLLTKQGPELVAAVVDVLRSFDFDAKDMDEGIPEHAPKREDVRIRVADSDWTALAEVKGYEKSGGRTADLRQVEKCARFFLESEKRHPSKLIYIVNQQFGLPPEQRRRPLAGSAEDVESFAADGGLVVGTTDLYRLHRDVGDKLTKEDARRILMDSTGVLEYPPKPTDKKGASK